MKAVHTKSLVLTTFFYATIGLAAALGLALLFYWSLRLNSSLDSLVNNTKSEPVYLVTYLLLTVGTILLFGINVPLMVYRFRRWGFPKLRSLSSGGLGGLVGVAASACPVCGSAILAAVGIAGGLAAFPLAGLELKAVSFGLMLVPILLTARDLRRLAACTGASCPRPRNASFGAGDRLWLVGTMGLIVFLGVTGWRMLASDPLVSRAVLGSSTTAASNTLYDAVKAAVLPAAGVQSKISLGESVVKLVGYGVIDPEKFLAIYQDRGGLPAELADVLTIPSNTSIHLTLDNANFYVNLLWPLGLANYMESNRESPIKGDSLFNFASTGGWDLGKEKNGGAYFNKFRIVPLTAEEEALVVTIAKNTFRPCCNNSTFFQDCNHGSALLGLLALGASQGLTEKELFREALQFNSHWFPDTYVKTALYFTITQNKNWNDVDPAEVMGYAYSAIGPWSQTVPIELAKIPNLLPQDPGGAGCST